MFKLVQIILVLSLISSASICLADDSETFKISSYIPEKFEDLELKLDGGVDLSDNSSDGSSIPHPGSTNTSHSIDDYSVFKSRLNFRIDSRYHYQTIQEWYKLSNNLSTYYRHSSDEQNYDRSDINSYNRSIQSNNKSNDYGFSSRTLLDAGKYLIHDLSLSANLNHQFYYTERRSNHDQIEGRTDFDTVNQFAELNLTDRENHRTTVTNRNSVDFDLLLGWGRKYKGLYAATALYMVDELRNEDRLISEPSKAQMLKLTELIYQIRLTHDIDKRIYRIESMQTIIDFFYNEGITDDNSPLAYLLIEDVWDFFPKHHREFGWMVKGGMGVKRQYEVQQSSSDLKTWRIVTRDYTDSSGIVTISDSYSESVESDYSKRKSAYVFYALQAEYHLPLSMKWQIDSEIGGNWRIRTDDLPDKDDRNQFGSRIIDGRVLYVAISCRYIYNSRSDLLINFGIEREDRLLRKAETIINNEVVDFKFWDDSRWNFDLNSVLSYRIAIPTTLKVKLAYKSSSSEDGRNDRDLKSSRSNYSLSASISHWLY